MVTVTGLGPEVAAVGTALGLLVPVPGGHRLEEDFFREPWTAVGGLVADDVQRGGLVEALGALLGIQAPAVLPALPAGGGLRACHPLLDPGGQGQLYLVADRTSAAPSAPLLLGLAAEGRSPAGPGVCAELTLLSADDTGVTALAATPEHPLRIEVRVPLEPGDEPGDDAVEVVVAALLVAPPDLDQSRLTVELHGLPGYDAPLVVDPFATGDGAGGGTAELAVALLQLTLDALGPGVPPPVLAVVQHLPTLLGLAHDLPPLPLAEVASDPGALRRWLAGLADAAADDGRPALLSWLDAVAGLLDAPPGTSPGGQDLPGEAAPARIVLVEGPPQVALTVAVRVDAATGDRVLVAGVTVEHPGGPGFDAVLRADAAFLALPLAGTAPAVVLERLDVVVEAPAGDGPLYPAPGDAAGPDQTVSVGRLRAGVRYTAGAAVEPLLELDDVRLSVGGAGGVEQSFERLDLTDATSLTAAASGLVDAAITAGLGGGAEDVAVALRTLLGLGTTPGLDLAAFAAAPTRALAGLYRELRTVPDGWPGALRSVATLLGSAAPEVTGDGTPDAPWRTPLEAFPAPGGSACVLSLLVWDGGDAALPEQPGFRLGLGLETRPGGAPEGEWAVGWTCELLAADLPDGGGGAVRWLGGQRLAASCAVPGDAPEVAGVAVGAGTLSVAAGWAPGAPLAVTATVSAVRVTVAGVPPLQVDLGDLVWPPPGGLDLAAPDLGLGIDPDLLWTALRPLLVRFAGTAGGAGLRDLLGLLGLAGPGSTGAARELPPLELGPDGLRGLLAAPLEAVRAWLAGLATDAAVTVAGGVPYLRPLLEALQAALTARTPPLPGQDTPAPDLPVRGVGTPDDPWTVPLHAVGEPPLELVTWLEPDGPPPTWAADRVAGLGGGLSRGVADQPDETDEGTDDETDDETGGTGAEAPAAVPGGMEIVAVAADVAGYLPGGAVLAATAPEAAAVAIDALASRLLEGDGVVAASSVAGGSDPAEGELAATDGWRAADPVDAAHHALPRAPAAVAAVLAEVAARTGGLAADEWAAVLLAPPLAGDAPWAGLLAGVPPTEVAAVSLRRDGVPPHQVDLGDLRAAAWYDVDLADDGTPSAADALSALTRVVDAVLREKPGARVLLVAHSYLGAVARAHADARPETVLGLVTLGTPRLGGAVDLTDPVTADGVRLADALSAPGMPGAAATQDAVSFLAAVLDGYAVPAPGRPPVPAAFPAAAFERWDVTALDPHGLPALAIAGRLRADLRLGLAGALTVGVAVAGQGRAAPTHVAWGVRSGLDLGPARDGEADVAVSVLTELGRLALLPGGLAPDRPPRLEVRATLRGAAGHLLGGPGDGTPQEARVRAADLVADVTPGPVTAVDVALHDVALRGDPAIDVALDDPRTAELLDRLVTSLDVDGVAGGRVDALLAALADLGVVRRRTQSSTGSTPAAVLADGVAGLRNDGTAWCAARLPALLDRPAGLLGLVRPAGAAAGGGPWTLAHPRLATETVVEPAPWRVTVRTTGTGLPLGPGIGPVGASLDATGVVDLTTLDPDVDAALAAGGLRLVRDAAGGPALAGAWLDPPLPLTGTSPDDVVARLAPLLPRLLVDAGLGAVLEHLHGEPVVSLGLLLDDPGRWVATQLGDGVLPDPERLAELLRAAAAETGLEDVASGTGAPLALPGGLLVRADPAPDGGLRLSMVTGAPVELWSDGAGGAATLALEAYLDVDATRAVRPGGSLTLHVPLPGDWPAIDVRAGADATGLSLAVDVTTAPGPPPDVVTVALLPVASGLERLVAAGAGRLLPAVLDALAGGIGARTPRPAVLDEVLAVADALGIHDPAGGFAAHGDALAALVTEVAAGGGAGAAAAGARVVLRRLLGEALVPDGATATELVVRVPAVLDGTVELRCDLGTVPPAVHLELSGLVAGPAGLDLALGYAEPDVVATAGVTLSVDTQSGVVLEPRLTAALAVDAGSGAAVLAVDLLPLGTAGVVVPLAPEPAPPTPGDLLALAGAWLVPLAGTLALRGAAGVLDTALWTGGRTPADILVSAGIAVRDGAAGELTLVPALPTPGLLLQGALDALDGVGVPLPGGPELALVSDGALYGVVVSGEVTVPAGSLEVAVRFGLPGELDVGWGEAGAGVGLLLLDLTDPDEPAVTPVLRLGGLGARVGGAEPGGVGPALVDTGAFRLGAAAAYIRADLPLTGAAALRRPAEIDGAVELEALGLPFAGGAGGDNPVAASLLQTGETDQAGGDAAPVNPPLDLLVGRGGGVWTVRFAGETSVVFEIHRSFGPLHIEELALLYQAAGSSPGKLGLSVDGGVAIAGLSVDVDDLTLLVPLDAPADVGAWEVDLAGLSVGMVAGPVVLAGGLLKTVLPDGTIDYAGMLSVDVAGRGFTAVGAYAQPSDELGDYTSMFVFVSVPIPLGGPPFLFILGFGGGVGYNRRLLVPRDPTGVPSFPLVAAIAEGGIPGGGSPMDALRAIAEDIPPARAAVWVAAGVKFSTFELLHTTAVAYVAVDGGTEIGLLGLMQMVLPADEAAVVSAELALAAMYSTVDQILSIRAELTSNSWLISPDCRLTGGFAFVIWFDRPDVLLSIGGYGPLYDPPADYPEVSPVGFNWSVGSGIVVKGESYFTLTPAALMFGGRLEASYDVSPVRVWFTAHLDVLIIWDPFHYVLDAGVSVGASFTIKVCFFACARISVNVQLGADVHLEGPPLHATVTVDLAIARVTVEFGGEEPQAFLSWPEASLKYLQGGSGRPPASVGVAAGGRAPEAGVTPDGTEDRPWQVAPEFTLRAESVMPLASWDLAGGASGAAGGRTVDVVPCGSDVGRVDAGLNLVLERRTGPDTWGAVPGSQLAALTATTATTGFPGGVWDADVAGEGTGGADSMVDALSVVQLAADVTVTEATGELGEIPFATLIEEETTRPLVFGPAASGAGGGIGGGIDGDGGRRPRARRAAPAAVDGPARGPRAPRAPRVRAAAGGARVWDVDRAAPHRLDGGENLRLVAVTGTGAVVADTVAGPGTTVPGGASRVLVTVPAGGDAGWDATTRLVPLSAATLVAPDAVVRLPRPWSAPARYRRPGEHSPVPAAVLTAAVDGLVTDLPPRVRTVVVLLDRRDPGADPDDVRVEVAGAAAGPRTSDATGARRRLEIPVTPDAGARSVGVTVVTGPGWRLAGVRGTTGPAAQPPAATAPPRPDPAVAVLTPVPPKAHAPHEPGGPS